MNSCFLSDLFCVDREEIADQGIGSYRGKRSFSCRCAARQRSTPSLAQTQRLCMQTPLQFGPFLLFCRSRSPDRRFLTSVRHVHRKVTSCDMTKTGPTFFCNEFGVKQASADNLFTSRVALLKIQPVLLQINSFGSARLDSRFRNCVRHLDKQTHVERFRYDIAIAER